MKKKYEKEEILELWTLYEMMLQHQDRGQKYSKTKFRNGHLAKHEGRTRGSYEAFMMNISTARDKQGLPLLKGYKPSMPNYNRYLDKLAVILKGAYEQIKEIKARSHEQIKEIKARRVA